MKNVLKKWTVGLMSSGLALVVFAGSASAHVTVKPQYQHQEHGRPIRLKFQLKRT